MSVFQPRVDTCCLPSLGPTPVCEPPLRAGLPLVPSQVTPASYAAAIGCWPCICPSPKAAVAAVALTTKSATLAPCAGWQTTTAYASQDQSSLAWPACLCGCHRCCSSRAALAQVPDVALSTDGKPCPGRQHCCCNCITEDPFNGQLPDILASLSVLPFIPQAPAGSTDQPAGSLHRSQRLLQAHSTPGRTLLQAIQDTRWLSPNGKKIERPNVSAAGLSVAWYNTPPSPQLPPGADGAWYRDQGQGSRLRVGKDDSEKPWEWKSPKKASEGRWIPLSASASAPPDEPTTSQAPAADTATPPLAPPAATTATATPAPATGSLPPPPAAGMPPITRPQAAPASNARVDPRQSPSPPAPKPPATPPVNQRGARPSNPASSTSPSAASVDPRQPLGQPTLSASQRSPTPPVDEGGVRAPRVPRGAPPTAADTLSSRPSSGSSSSSSPGSASAMALPLRNDNWVKLVGRAKPEPTAAWYVYKPLPDDKEGLRVVKDETDYQRPSFAEGRELGEECGDDKTGPYASCKNSVW